MKAYERLIKYARVYTPSNEESTTHPSTNWQFVLAKMLVEELKELGVENARVDDKCYVYASVPATPGSESQPAIGLIAHMDTVSDFCDHEVCPVIHENYSGEDLELTNEDGTQSSGRTLKVSDFPWLASMKGQTLITTDGTTVLGADDKAGIAEIMTFVEYVMAHPEYAHGKICIGFTPDEEIGAGADYFDVTAFGADFAYTLDGDLAGEIQYENFNAAGAKVEVVGCNVHPGSAKDVMVNAIAVASEFHSRLPKEQVPEKTEGYDGFFHLTDMAGDVASAKISYIIRDHDAAKFEEKLNVLRNLEAKMNEIYPEGTVTLHIREQYRNMREKIEPCYHVVERAIKATEAAGVVPTVTPIRGGTDGARLSFMGLPCPNLGTGGSAFHGPFEHITAESMDQVVNILIELIKI